MPGAGAVSRPPTTTWGRLAERAGTAEAHVDRGALPRSAPRDRRGADGAAQGFVAVALNEVEIDVADQLSSTRGAIYKVLHDARTSAAPARARRPGTGERTVTDSDLTTRLLGIAGEDAGCEETLARLAEYVEGELAGREVANSFRQSPGISTQLPGLRGGLPRARRAHARSEQLALASPCVMWARLSAGCASYPVHRSPRSRPPRLSRASRPRGADVPPRRPQIVRGEQVADLQRGAAAFRRELQPPLHLLGALDQRLHVGEPALAGSRRTAALTALSAPASSCVILVSERPTCWAARIVRKRAIASAR